ncbi:MAG TPA: metalloregulator ArsR/SmtB family transcription factor [Candidatus Limnocylindrales bacterium]
MAARQARTVARPAEPAKVAPVRDFTGGAPQFAIEWDVRPAYDFLFSLSPESGQTDDLPSPDRRWLKDARAALGERVKDGFGRLTKEEIPIHLAGYVVDRPELTTAAEVVGAMRADGHVAVLRHLFGDMHSNHAMDPLVEPALGGDAAAIAELRSRYPAAKHSIGTAALEDPAAEFEMVLAILEGWAEAFAEVEPRVAAILQRDYDLRAEDRASLAGIDLVERTTNGIRLVPEPGIRRVILAPSYFSRPYNFLLGGADWRFDGYPVADAALDLDPLAPPATVLRLHRALGDETRLRILKLLADRDLYLTEIAELLELSKPTIKHHLAMLRVAGLLTVIEAGPVTYYHLRRERLDEATGGLRAFLGS